MNTINMSNNEMMAEITRLREANAKLLDKGTLKHGLKVSPKGAISVYGMGKWPVTLYRSQWERLLGMSTEIQEFIVNNAEKLTTKQ